MPLWAWFYFLVTLVLAVLDTRARLRHGDSVSFVVTSALSSLCSLAAIWAFWHAGFAAFLGRSLFITTLFALVWDCMTMKYDARSHIPAPHLSPALNSVSLWLTIGVSFCLLLPAYYMGFVAAYAQLYSHERPNQAMQRTASRRTVHLVSVCHPPFPCERSHRGLAVADLVSR